MSVLKGSTGGLPGGSRGRFTPKSDVGGGGGWWRARSPGLMSKGRGYPTM